MDRDENKDKLYQVIEVRIVLTAAREDAELRAQLTKLPEPLPAPGEDAEGAVLERRAVVQRRGPALNVRARPPEPGAFELRIFAREGAGFQLAASYLLQAKLDGPPLDEFDEAAA